VAPAVTARQARDALRRACRAARGALNEAGYSSGQIARATGVSDAVVRKLTADGDKTGWRVPTERTCLAIDEFCLTRLGRSFRLKELREQLKELGGTADAVVLDREIEAPLRDYLARLVEALTAIPAWVPFDGIDDGFQQRLVAASSSPSLSSPTAAGSAAVVRGDVPWANAVGTEPVVVVTADAGYGKTWQARVHAAGLAREALMESEAASARIPIWAHTSDLAAAWPGESPIEALVRAGTAVLRREGIDTREMQDVLVGLATNERSPFTVVVDAYDEVAGDTGRARAGKALSWPAACASASTSAPYLAYAGLLTWCSPGPASRSSSTAASGTGAQTTHVPRSRTRSGGRTRSPRTRNATKTRQAASPKPAGASFASGSTRTRLQQPSVWRTSSNPDVSPSLKKSERSEPSAAPHEQIGEHWP
jgi:hypothetical protein